MPTLAEYEKDFIKAWVRKRDYQSVANTATATYPGMALGVWVVDTDNLYFQSPAYKKPTLLAVRCLDDDGISIRTSQSEADHYTVNGLNRVVMKRLIQDLCKEQDIVYDLVSRLTAKKAYQGAVTRMLEGSL